MSQNNPTSLGAHQQEQSDQTAVQKQLEQVEAPPAMAQASEQSTEQRYVMSSKGLPINATHGLVAFERRGVLLRNVHFHTTQNHLEELARDTVGVTPKEITLHFKQGEPNGAATLELCNS